MDIDDDRFDFRDYAEVLAERARKAEPPLTIGLNGSWGSGKTSLMWLMEQQLKGIETIWINVWQPATRMKSGKRSSKPFSIG